MLPSIHTLRRLVDGLRCSARRRTAWSALVDDGYIHVAATLDTDEDDDVKTFKSAVGVVGDPELSRAVSYAGEELRRTMIARQDQLEAEYLETGLIPDACTFEWADRVLEAEADA